MQKNIDKKWQDFWVQDGQHTVDLNRDSTKFYLLSMFPYPSGNLHIGHWYAFAPADAYARYLRMTGSEVFFPIGFDAFGLPAENAAIKNGVQPAEWTEKNIVKMTEQLKSMGCSFTWDHTLATCKPEYYRWNQWLFVRLFEKKLIYKDNSPVDYCPSCKTTIAKEQIIDDKCERCQTEIVEKQIPSWKIAITKYKDELIKDLDNLPHWPEKVKKMQRKWLQDLRDWNVSRQRMWGTPIPIIYCPQCGTVPVDGLDLPVKLPTDAEFLPTGESPLKNHPDFKNCKCTKCGGDAERETDTLDTFFCSSWYQYAYLYPGCEIAPFNPTVTNRWCPVDLYTGGIEHACMHLIYFRFFTKFLSDIGLIDFREPAIKLFNQGTILGPDGQKMSKSRGNVIDPDPLVEQYGADVVRLALMFIGPWDQGGPWNPNITGVVRFLEDVKELVNKPKVKQDSWAFGPARTDLPNFIDKTIVKINDSYAQLKFNLVISHLMSLRNEMFDSYDDCANGEWQDAIINLLLMLAPLAPHTTEELWQSIGQKGSIHRCHFPYLSVSRKIKNHSSGSDIVIQVDGKKKMVIKYFESDGLVEKLPEVLELLEGLEIEKVIKVENRLVNFVIKKIRTVDD